MRLAGQAALVTGATQGIGRVIAERLAAEGACVMLCGRTAEKGEAVVRGITQQGGQARFIRCDVSEEDEVCAAVDATVNAFGPLTILVNNAAPMDQLTSGGDGTVLDISTEHWERMLRVGISSVFWSAKYALPHMMEVGYGSVVNIATVSALRGEAGLDGYTAAKGAMIAITRSMATEFGSHRIRVNALAPGFIASSDSPNSLAIRDDPVMSKAFLAGQLLPDWGAPEDVAAAVAWLSSPEAKFVTGVVIPIDGGATAYSRMPNFQSPALREAFATVARP
jgi:meso-butanediol dehydrogenase / (S,S)-butanediol dehydrogenase / diacetyl reductase